MCKLLFTFPKPHTGNIDESSLVYHLINVALMKYQHFQPFL